MVTLYPLLAPYISGPNSPCFTASVGCVFIIDPSIIYFFLIFWGTLFRALSSLVIGVARVGGGIERGLGADMGFCLRGVTDFHYAPTLSLLTKQ